MGSVVEAYSISAGLDYPGVGPEHAYFKDKGIACYVAVNDEEALAAFQRLTAHRGDYSGNGKLACHCLP